ncbi:DUF2789 family protein [Pontibacterium sp. N1Y112]|uniref:DUF2789 family protein n=1 Tax=Pontibacterium sinense TaxID=2781979 RepID=A0A8J7K6B4_9GAMM|nr:DUF2789 family protein [Pontibacterium sinense]
MTRCVYQAARRISNTSSARIASTVVDIKLTTATFWTSSLSSFLKESLNSESDWSERVDELDSMLRH